MRLRTSKAKPVEPDELDDTHGVLLVRLARSSVEHFMDKGVPPKPPEGLDELLTKPGAAFVTIQKVGARRGEKELRGCIGTISPVHPLLETVVRVAIDAAFRDPRFPPLTRNELDEVIFEVSVLSRLKPLGRGPRDRISGIKVGRDGVVVVRGPNQGLLLPQVPLDYGWNELDFLGYACIKAGLPANCWLDKNTLIYRFTVASWSEVEPRGRITRTL
ncbi:MAG: AmmeMemoRadiSam system protein A [Desulfurococcales archaeon]|nr:AmmeMemoRadiSam system protein A [Desulfurococcales archaeon]